MRQVDHFIVGGAGGGTGRKHQIWNPSTGEVQAEVALGDAALLDKAVATAKKVQPDWAATNPQSPPARRDLRPSRFGSTGSRSRR